MTNRTIRVRSTTRLLLTRPCVTGLAMVLLAGSLSGCAGRSAEQAAAPTAASIAGRYIATLGDGDAAAGAVGGAAKGTDALTLIRLPIADSAAGVAQWDTSFAQLPVANTMAGHPGVVAISAIGDAAFVISGKGPTPASWQGTGDGVVSVDLADPMAPKIGTMSMMGLKPRAIALSPMGNLLAVACDKQGAQIAIARVEGGALSSAAAWSLADLGLAENTAAYSVAWHPSGRFLAVVLSASKSVAFFEVDQSGGGLGLAPWGGAVSLGDTDQTPAFGAFTDDGDTFVVVSQGFTGGAPTPGSVASIRFERDATMTPGADGREVAQANHSVLGRAAAGISPTGLAISGGSVIVTSARAGTSAGAGGIVSLINLSSDGQFGGVREVDAGGIPMGVTLTADKGAVVVSRVSAAAGAGADGELVFYTLQAGRGDRAGDLLKADFTVGVGSMPHGAVIVR
ncbi:MAG: hypothetical protein K2X32_04290 [Phycisphaerales bacterium]|nr:hypothetical protein [Phycisphaerales bacterium]